MRTDTIFYQLFQTFPGLLFELIGEPPELAEHYEFSSREIKELSRRFDGIFLPDSETEDRLTYFVEVQFQPKADFYWRFFTEIFVYLGQYQPPNNWCAVAIFASRSLNPGIPRAYQCLETTQQVQVVYLDELQERPSSSLSLEIVKLIVTDQEQAVEQGRQLIQIAQQQQFDVATQQKVLQLLEIILIYKFTQLSREEIEAMFGFSDLKQTRFYQEAKDEGKLEGKLEGKVEGKLESIPSLLALGLTPEQIAGALNLDVEMVRQVASPSSTENN